MEDLEQMELALRDRPDIAEHWLVYADWLTEQGDARGELIVLEYRMKDPSLSEQEHLLLREKIADLAEAHRSEWLPGWVPTDGCRLNWRHGFVIGASCHGDSAIASVSAILSEKNARFFTRLSISGGESHAVQSLCAALPSSEIHTLGFDTMPLDVRWLSADVLGKLRALCLERALSREHLEDLVALLPDGLVELALPDNHLEDTHAKILAESKLPHPLDRLDLSNNQIRDPGAKAIAAAPWIARLGQINLSYNRVGRSGAAALGAARMGQKTSLAGNRSERSKA